MPPAIVAGVTARSRAWSSGCSRGSCWGVLWGADNQTNKCCNRLYLRLNTGLFRYRRFGVLPEWEVGNTLLLERCCSFQIRTCDGANRPPRRTRGLPLGTEAAQRSHKRMPMRGSSPCGRETRRRWLRSNWRSESLEVQRDNTAQATVRSSCCRVNTRRDSDFGDEVALAVRELPWRARIPRVNPGATIWGRDKAE